MKMNQERLANSTHETLRSRDGVQGMGNNPGLALLRCSACACNGLDGAPVTANFAQHFLGMLAE